MHIHLVPIKHKSTVSLEIDKDLASALTYNNYQLLMFVVLYLIHYQNDRLQEKNILKLENNEILHVHVPPHFQ